MLNNHLEVIKMYYLGIDIGKDKHVAAMIGLEGNICLKAFSFNADISGYQKLLSNIANITADKSDIQVALEATGHYWLNLYEKLTQDGFRVVVLNPLQVRGFRNQGIRGSKTDTIDAVLIARVLRFGETIETKFSEDAIMALRQLTRYRADLVDQVTMIKNKCLSLLDQVFPEYNRLFSNSFGQASLQLLKEASTPEEVLKLDNNKLLVLLDKASKGRFGIKTVLKIKEAAKDSFGLKTASDAFGFQIKLIISQIEHMKNIINTLEEKISQLYDKLNLKLTSLPGVSTTCAASIIAEVEDVNKFHSKRGGAAALVAYAGMDPKVHQSGKYKGQAKMSKRGSHYLRRAVYNASFVASNIDEFFKSIYVKQRNKGKPHKVALSHVCTKMLHVIYSMLKNNTGYLPLKNLQTA